MGAGNPRGTRCEVLFSLRKSK